MIYSLTEHVVVLSQEEQFDVLDLYKIRTQDLLVLKMYYHSFYFGLIDRKIH